jgi:hypothetical protein
VLRAIPELHKRSVVLRESFAIFAVKIFFPKKISNIPGINSALRSSPHQRSSKRNHLID